MSKIKRFYETEGFETLTYNVDPKLFLMYCEENNISMEDINHEVVDDYLDDIDCDDSYNEVEDYSFYGDEGINEFIEELKCLKSEESTQ